MAEIKRFLIYPWDMSVTNSWTLDGLHALRDLEPAKIAEAFKGDDFDEMFISAIAEYLSHGYVRKAAEVTRALVETNPFTRQLVNERFDDSLARKLLSTKLDDLPRTASEFARSELIEYVQ